MKSTSKLVMFSFAFLAVAASAYAQSPRDELKQMVEQLQKTPNDNALREKIIKLGAEIKPAPAIPEEAERRLARGEAAFERAKDPADYANAVREFQAAATAAPWFAAPYFNLGVTEEKADHPKEAMESFRWYLLAAPEAKDAAEVKKRLFKLEYAAEQQSQAAALNAKQAAIRAQEQRISGTWQRRITSSSGHSGLQILYVRKTSDGRWNLSTDFYVDNIQVGKEEPLEGAPEVAVVDGELRFKSVSTMTGVVCATYEVRGAVHADGNRLSLAYTLSPFASDRPDGTCPPKTFYRSRVDAYTR